ncbi:DUF4376 domain-containing protein [Prevotella pallens]|uniref:DUF4376 domain-containing protein n=1 Tax=Prevotella pallens TaxID=60133 RepID=UPI0028E22C06|nr:DUF4376 domain-containing protein [Prevotella pallens]
MIEYRKGEEIYNGSYIVAGDSTIINPTEETLLTNGYEKMEVPEDELKDAISAKVAEIKAYDQSDAVNSFKLNGMSVWINREDRIGTRRAIELDAEAGKTESDIWLHGFHLRVNCQLAMKLLDMVGSYAYEAYNVTQQHLYAVQQLKTAEDVRKYDHTQGYPEKLDLKTTV